MVFSSHSNPNDGRIATSESMTFLLRAVTVLPQMAKERLLNREKAQAMKESDIQVVFPLRTAPSQMMASHFR